jgi:ketosteroid isomerase-like protein
MSQENLKIARTLLNAWNAGDTDAVRALYHPDIVALTAEGWPEPGPWVGRDAVMRSLEQILDTWDTGAFEPISFIDAGDRVVARQLWHGVGRGPDLNLEFTTVGTYRKGKVVLLEFFWDHVEALEAVGLSDEGTPQDNVDVVRRWLTAMQESPDELRAAVAECWDASADYYPVRKFPEARPCHSLEEIREFFAHQFEDAFSQWDLKVRSVIVAGDDRVLASTNLQAQGRGSGIDLDSDLHHCFWLRHGRFLRVEDHLTMRGALAALGLE